MRVAVVGGGLAGTLAVQQCVARGVADVRWIDAAGPRASDVPCALVHPFVGRSFQLRPGLAEAWRASRAWLEALPPAAHVHRAPLWRWLDENHGASRLERSWNAHRPQIETLVRGWSGGTADGAWLAYEPAFGVALGPAVTALTSALAARGVCRSAGRVLDLQAEGAGWRVLTTEGDLSVDAVLVAAGRGTAALMASHCPGVGLADYAGALRFAPVEAPLARFHIDGGHLCSTRQVAAWGSTYRVLAAGEGDSGPAIDAAHRGARVAAEAGEGDPGPALDALEARLRRREDWPVAGEVRTWAGVRTVEPRRREPWAAQVRPGLFVLSALGSKGGLWTPWLAVRLVDDLVGA